MRNRVPSLSRVVSRRLSDVPCSVGAERDSVMTLVDILDGNSSSPRVGKPRVYVSYTWRTKGLRSRALRFAEKLRKAGIDARIDGFTAPDPLPDRDSWAEWQEEQVRDAD